MFTHLDIGGGYPGYETKNDLFIEVASTINDCLENHFGDRPGLVVIAEPGIYIPASIALPVDVVFG